MSGTTPELFPTPTPKIVGRAHLPDLSAVGPGQVVRLDPVQANHLVRVRRADDGACVEVFDDAGYRARGRLQLDPQGVAGVMIDEVAQPGSGASGESNRALLRIASAVPKGNRADWLVEKLSELGVSEWIPLRTRRAVVVPGDNKLDRFGRIARESAKQCQREGVMRIGPVREITDVLDLIAAGGCRACVLSTRRPSRALADWLRAGDGPMMGFIGPEGDWDPSEEQLFKERGIAAVTLGPTILRVETAAVAAAVGVMLHVDSERVG